jgi:hypothetical protein
MKTITLRDNALLGVALVGALLPLGCASAPETFRTPEDAAAAFVAALRPYDAEKMDRVVGPGAEEVITSGDPDADEDEISTFVSDYEQCHVFEPGPGGATTLVVGDDGWPLPIPIIKAGNGYRFDLDRGRDDILTRRIGCNELDAIQVCRAIVDAQRDYHATNHSSAGVYASKFMSDAGTHDGLYWPTAEGEPESPLGELVAEAADNTEGRSYCGYTYRILEAQGPDAPGGARSYMVDGKLQDGFGVVAYPAEYGRCGIMTFIVNQNGVVYQRDLGEKTPEIAGSMKAFNPDAGWDIVPLQ